ncbi:MAG: helical backbone metal receptor [bacterium]|nr:helical backbone metal receptor [bacterium]
MKKLLIIGIVYIFCFCKTGFAYERIISLGPVLTEEICLLNASAKLIGCTVYCKTDNIEKKVERVGTVIEVNIEKIVSLEPDLVLATNLTDVKAVAKLKSLGINVLKFPLAKDYNDLCEKFLELGELVGKKKEAEQIIKDSKDKVELIRNKIKKGQKTTVFVELGSKPLFALASDSFGNDFIEFAGGVNIARGLKIGYYSREEVFKNDPDVIIIADMGISSEEEKKAWEEHKVLKAVKNKRVHIFDAYALCSPTPVTFIDTLEKIVKILQHE